MRRGFFSVVGVFTGLPQLICAAKPITICIVLYCLISSTSVLGAKTGQIKGVITDQESGEPLRGAAVAVIGTAMGAMTDSSGAFVIRFLRSGIHSLKISHLDYAPIEVVDVMVLHGQTTEVIRSLARNPVPIREERVNPDTVDLIHLPPTLTNTSALRGTDSGKPVTTVEELLEQVAGVVQDSNGVIFIRGGRAGEVAYIIRDGPISGGPFFFHSIKATRSGSIEGTIIDEQTGSPVEGAEVRLIGGHGFCKTNPDGEYEVFGLTGTYTLNIKHPAYFTYEVEHVRVACNETTHLSLEIKRKNLHRLDQIDEP